MNLNYRDVVNISGTGKRHLLLGLSSEQTVNSMAMHGNDEVQTFSYNYNKFDVLRKSRKEVQSGYCYLE